MARIPDEKIGNAYCFARRFPRRVGLIPRGRGVQFLSDGLLRGPEEGRELMEITMGKTLKERLNKLPTGRRAKVDARADELMAEEMCLKRHGALLRSKILRRSVGRSEVS
jgi:hypothetical protein